MGVDYGLCYEIDRVAQQCSVPDWDGYDAWPVTKEQALQAKAFVETLPPDFPLPEVSAEPDGCITFDWSNKKGEMINASVTKDGEVVYVWSDGDMSGGGCFELREAPTLGRGLYDAVRRLTA